jgi:hypothetical protein
MSAPAVEEFAPASEPSRFAMRRTAPADRPVLVLAYALAVGRHFSESLRAVAEVQADRTALAPFSERDIAFGFGDEWAWLDQSFAPPPNGALMISTFVRGLFDRLHLDSAVFVYSLVILERFIRAFPWASAPIQLHTVRPIVLTSVSIASKVCYDEPMHIAELVHKLGYSSLTALALGHCEVAFLNAIDFKTVVYANVIATYENALRRMVMGAAWQQTQDSPRTPGEISAVPPKSHLLSCDLQPMAWTRALVSEPPRR